MLKTSFISRTHLSTEFSSSFSTCLQDWTSYLFFGSSSAGTFHEANEEKQDEQFLAGNGEEFEGKLHLGQKETIEVNGMGIQLKVNCEIA